MIIHFFFSRLFYWQFYLVFVRVKLRARMSNIWPIEFGSEWKTRGKQYNPMKDITFANANSEQVKTDLCMDIEMLTYWISNETEGRTNANTNNNRRFQYIFLVFSLLLLLHLQSFQLLVSFDLNFGSGIFRRIYTRIWKFNMSFQMMRHFMCSSKQNILANRFSPSFSFSFSFSFLFFFHRSSAPYFPLLANH